jgi:hypothetical protein
MDPLADPLLRVEELHAVGAVSTRALLLLLALESGAAAGDPEAAAFQGWASERLGLGAVTLAALLGAAGGPAALWLRWLRAFVARTRMSVDGLDLATDLALRLMEAAPGLDG